MSQEPWWECKEFTRKPGDGKKNLLEKELDLLQRGTYNMNEAIVSRVNR